MASSSLRSCRSCVSRRHPRPRQPVITRDGDAVTVRATRIATPIKIDGRLDEAVYERCRRSPSSSSRSPTQGAPVTENDRSVGAVRRQEHLPRLPLLGRASRAIVANDMRRDSSNLSQQRPLRRRARHVPRPAQRLPVLRHAGRRHARRRDRPTSGRTTPTGTGLGRRRPARFDGGWIAEMAIPFKSLRYRPGREQTWGIQLRRSSAARTSTRYITPIEAAVGHQRDHIRISAAATLVGLEAPPPAHEPRDQAVRDLAASRPIC